MTSDDWVKIIGAIATGVGLIISVILRNYAAIKETQRRVDGRLDELLNLTRTSAHAAGRAEERGAGQDAPPPDYYQLPEETDAQRPRES